MLWLLKSSSYTKSGTFQLLMLLCQRGGWICKRSWEETQPKQLIQTNLRDIQYHVTSYWTIKLVVSNYLFCLFFLFVFLPSLPLLSSFLLPFLLKYPYLNLWVLALLSFLSHPTGGVESEQKAVLYLAVHQVKPQHCEALWHEQIHSFISFSLFEVKSFTDYRENRRRRKKIRKKKVNNYCRNSYIQTGKHRLYTHCEQYLLCAACFHAYLRVIMAGNTPAFLYE